MAHIAEPTYVGSIVTGTTQLHQFVFDFGSLIADRSSWHQTLRAPFPFTAEEQHVSTCSGGGMMALNQLFAAVCLSRGPSARWAALRARQLDRGASQALAPKCQHTIQPIQTEPARNWMHTSPLDGELAARFLSNLNPNLDLPTSVVPLRQTNLGYCATLTLSWAHH